MNKLSMSEALRLSTMALRFCSSMALMRFCSSIALLLLCGSITLSFAAPAPVFKTGQATPYYTGDDGTLQRGVAWPTNSRFTSNTDGTVTDNLTGLVWLKDANCLESVGGIAKSSGYLTWQNALTWSNNLASGKCGLSDGSTSGQWRLPSREELASLVDFAYYNPALSNTTGTGKWMQGNPFDNVQSSAYWTATTFAYANFANRAWYVHMSIGSVSANYKTGGGYVWPVRGGQSGSLISGTVTANGAGVNNVTMTLSGAISQTTITVSDGTYSFSGLPDGTYTITPSLAGYAFSPSSQTVNIAGASVPGQDFEGMTFAYSPEVLLSKIDIDNSGLAGGTFIIHFLEKFKTGNFTITFTPFFGGTAQTYDAGTIFDSDVIIPLTGTTDQKICVKISSPGLLDFNICSAGDQILGRASDSLMASKRLSETKTNSSDVLNNFPNQVELHNESNTTQTDVDSGLLLTHRITDFDRIIGKDFLGMERGINTTWDASDYVNSVDKGDSGRIPLLLIHGWQGDNGLREPAVLALWENSELQYWQHFLDYYLTSTELQAKYHVYLYHYPSYKHITYNAKMLNELLNTVKADKPDSDLGAGLNDSAKGVTILAHSMGGLLSRALVEEYGDTPGITPALGPAAASLRKLITLDTPHHGSFLTHPELDVLFGLSPNGWVKDLETQGAADLNWDNFDNHFPNSDIYTNNAVRWDTTKINTDGFDTIYWNKYCPGGNCPGTFNPWLTWLNNSFASVYGNYMDKYVFYNAWNVDSASAFNSIADLDFINNGKYSVPTEAVGMKGFAGGGAEPVTSSLFSDKAYANSVFYPGENTYPTCPSGNCGKTVIYNNNNVPFIRYSDGADHPYRIPYRIFWDYDHEKMLNGVYSSNVGDWDKYIKNNAASMSQDTAFTSNQAEYIQSALGIAGRSIDYSTSVFNPLKNEPVFIVLQKDLLELKTLQILATFSGTGFGAVRTIQPGISCDYQIAGYDCDEPYAAGTVVTLTAEAAPGYTFTRWEGDCTGINPTIVVTMNGDKLCSAVFDDIAPPVVAITNYPVNPTSSTSATFSYSSSEANSTFECSLDSADYTQCAVLGIQYPNLMPGNHTFSVRATDSAGNVSSPASFSWLITMAKVTVLTPNGGEKIATGSTYQITWGAPSEATKFTLQYSINNGIAWKIIANNVTGNSFNWTVPAQTANKTGCLIQITGYNVVNSFVGVDQSNAVFRMEVIKLNSPNGGESWNSGTVHPITWTTGASIKPIAKVNLYYKIDATGYKLITSFTGTNPGTYNWTVPTVTANKLASKVKVELQYTGITAKGNDLNDANFTIKPAGAPVQNSVAGESSEYLIQRVWSMDMGIGVTEAVMNMADESLTKEISTKDGKMLVWTEPENSAIGVGIKSGISPETLSGEYLTALYGEDLITLNLDRIPHTITDGHLTITTDRGSYRGLVREDGSIFTITGAQDSGIFGIGMKKTAASLINGTYRISELSREGEGASVKTKEMTFDGNGGYTLSDGAVIVTGTYEPTAEGTFETSEGDTIIVSEDGEVITIIGLSNSETRLAIGIKKK
ncbi:MAG: DUF1566 domain-containing protein [Nitrospirae bacterium]|nr:DUF1566 domain-containing protein [Nitrospirota bacterium]